MSDSLRESLTASIAKLAVLRESVSQRSERIKAARAGFDDTIRDDLLKLEADRRALEAEESAVRGMALVEHETTGEKKPAPGVSVVFVKEYDIDEAAALVWAKTHGLCLVPESLDVRALRDLATVQPLPFVTVTESPAVRISSDLLKELGEASHYA